jgi:uncharacterized protein YndB with AHSA1/START domain
VSERGFLVCADITGYTNYLDESELDHASRILADLLDLLLGEIQNPLRLSRVEGDAVISYAPGLDGINPQILVDRIEATYVVFRRALDQIAVNTLCSCRACGNLSWLDLKFIVHHGEFVVQRIGNQDELVGPDVNLMFRLTKNTIRETLGIPGYLALTEAAVEALDMPGYVADLIEHVESPTEGSPVGLRVRDMASLWVRRRSEGTIDLAAEGVLLTVERALPVRLSVAWDYLTRPTTRSVYFGATATDVLTLDDGRVGVDAVYVCQYGDERLEHQVVDWDPPSRYAFTAPVGDGLTSIGEFRLQPDFERTLVTFRAAVPRGPDGDRVTEDARAAIADELTSFFTAAFDRLAERIEQDRAA